MSEYHFPIPGSADEEKIVKFIRRHWASYLGQFIFSAFILLFPIILYIIIKIYFPGALHGLVTNFLVLLGSIYYLVALNVAFISWVSFYYDLYIICEDEIIDVNQQGFFSRKITQLSLLRVQDVTSKTEGLMSTIFSYGDIMVETAGEESHHFVMYGVPNPQEVCAKILELHNQLVERESREAELAEGEGSLGKYPAVHNRPGAQNENTNTPSQSAEITQPARTSYQQMLEKDSASQQSQVSQENVSSQLGKTAESTQPIPPLEEQNIDQQIPEKPQPPSQPQQNKEDNSQEGQVDEDKLDKGGEIDLR